MPVVTPACFLTGQSMEVESFEPDIKTDPVASSARHVTTSKCLMICAYEDEAI